MTSVGSMKNTKTHRRRKVYVPATYRQRYQLKNWQMDALERAIPNVPEVRRFAAAQRQQLADLRAKQGARARARDEAMRAQVEGLGAREKLEAQAAVRKHSEGTLEPSHTADKPYLHYGMPPALATGLAVPPWPLPKTLVSVEELHDAGALPDAPPEDVHDEGPGGHAPGAPAPTHSEGEGEGAGATLNASPYDFGGGGGARSSDSSSSSSDEDEPQGQ